MTVAARHEQGPLVRRDSRTRLAGRRWCTDPRSRRDEVGCAGRGRDDLGANDRRRRAREDGMGTALVLGVARGASVTVVLAAP
jgi:hypothetical protein